MHVASHGPERRQRRPLSLLLIWALIAVLGLLDLARTIQVIMQRKFLAELELSISPTLIALASGVWALILLACALGLWRRRPWARPATALAVPLHEMTFLAMRAAFTQQGAASAPLTLLAAGVTTLVAWVLLSLPGTKRALRTRDKP